MTDDYPGVTEFGVLDPNKVSVDVIKEVTTEATHLRVIGAKMLVTVGHHPKLGSVLILDQDDGSGGFVYADKVGFA
ncbi:hypothetical protein [Bradyrhizobium sp. CCBAU 25338]|uniref:hypothetical protein n=1 Tax=Bradyrhizobium sp. CCBAU 25338 TaxID=1641877 RepID=UPI0023023DEC|nr:hypothetical protein [Bradyrhizobium sp. CCBAU 25338]